MAPNPNNCYRLSSPDELELMSRLKGRVWPQNTQKLNLPFKTKLIIGKVESKQTISYLTLLGVLFIEK